MGILAQLNQQLGRRQANQGFPALAVGAQFLEVANYVEAAKNEEEKVQTVSLLPAL